MYRYSKRERSAAIFRGGGTIKSKYSKRLSGPEMVFIFNVGGIGVLAKAARKVQPLKLFWASFDELENHSVEWYKWGIKEGTDNFCSVANQRPPKWCWFL